MERTYYINGIQYDEQEFLQEMVNAGAMVQDIVDLADGYSFVGDNGNMFDVEFFGGLNNGVHLLYQWYSVQRMGLLARDGIR